MDGPEIVARSLTHPRPPDKYGNRWQYHPRSDRHSKVACWAILFDLLRRSQLLRDHVGARKVVFGVNHEMRDYATGRRKNLDLVLARPANGRRKGTFADLADHFAVDLTHAQRMDLESLPAAEVAPVGSVQMALEAKACMTEHLKARPRLYDELNSSHLTIHGASDQAVAVGFAMVNLADSFISPDLNKQPVDEENPPRVTAHRQPDATQKVLEKLQEIPRRSRSGEAGFDALGIVVVDAPNDASPIRVVTSPPAPQRDDIYHYDRMIDRVQNQYEVLFRSI